MLRLPVAGAIPSDAGGLLTMSQSLKSEASGARVKVRENSAMITDGPFAETKEVKGGHFVDTDAYPKAPSHEVRHAHAHSGEYSSDRNGVGFSYKSQHPGGHRFRPDLDPVRVLGEAARRVI